MKVLRSADGPAPLLLGAWRPELPLPTECGCAPDSGPERATRTLHELPTQYELARQDLEQIVGHPFEQVVVNAYSQPMNLYLHNDKPDIWGAVAIVSLGAPSTLVLVPAASATWGDLDVLCRPGWEILFQHGDVVYLTTEANHYWFHGGVMVAGRFSLVLREFQLKDN